MSHYPLMLFTSAEVYTCHRKNVYCLCESVVITNKTNDSAPASSLFIVTYLKTAPNTRL
jgi:hypothetical protein